MLLQQEQLYMWHVHVDCILVLLVQILSLAQPIASGRLKFACEKAQKIAVSLSNLDFIHLGCHHATDAQTLQF